VISVLNIYICSNNRKLLPPPPQLLLHVLQDNPAIYIPPALIYITAAFGSMSWVYICTFQSTFHWVLGIFNSSLGHLNSRWNQ